MANENERDIPEMGGDAPTGTVKISTEPDEGEDDFENEGGAPVERPAQAARGPKAGSRAERRNLFQENKSLREQVGKIPTQLQEMRSGFERQLAELRGALTARPAQTQEQARAADPLANAITETEQAIAAEMDRLRHHDHSKGGFDFTRTNQLQKRMRQLEFQDWQRQNQGQQQQNQVPPEAIAARVEMTQRYNTLVQEFPWVGQNEQARQACGAMLKYLISQGRPNTIATDREAATRVEADFGLGNRTPRRASPRTEQQYGGLRDFDRSNGAPPREVELPAEQLEGTGLSDEQIRRMVVKRVRAG